MFALTWTLQQLVEYNNTSSDMCNGAHTGHQHTQNLIHKHRQRTIYCLRRKTL